MSVFYCFRDITIYWSTVCAFLAVFTHPLLVFKPSHKGFPWDLRMKVGIKHIESRLPGGETARSYEHLSSHGTGLWQTDWRTDRQTAHPVAKSRSSIAERDKNAATKYRVATPSECRQTSDKRCRRLDSSSMHYIQLVTVWFLRRSQHLM